jgi:hypothetical protein
MQMPKTNNLVSKPLSPSVTILTLYSYTYRLMKNGTFLSNLLLVLISLFYLLNASGRHDWGGDFSMYIMNAINIVKGTPYSQTGYIYNPDVAFYGPPAYPPVFPLMLSPFISIWGINLQVLKLPGIFCFIGVLIFLNNKILPKNLSLVSKFICLIGLGLYPFFFFLSESIISDFPFLLLSYIALNRINNQLAHSAKESLNWVQYLVTGFLIYLAYGTRSVGLILLPVAFLFSLLQNKKITTSLVVIFCVALLLIVGQSLLIPQTGAYFDQFPKSLSGIISTILKSIWYYLALFVGIFSIKNFTVQLIVFLIMVGGFILGLIIRFKKGISSFDLFYLIYLALLLIWPSYQDWRFLVPIIPLYFLYITEGFDRLFDSIQLSWLRKTLPYIMLSCLIIFYASTYIVAFPRPISDIEKKETNEIFQFIRTETNSDDVILFFKPRVLVLFTQRKSVAIAIPSPNGDTLERMKELGVSIVILRLNYAFEDQPELSQLISTHLGNFQLLFENPEFRVYRVNN